MRGANDTANDTANVCSNFSAKECP